MTTLTARFQSDAIAAADFDVLAIDGREELSRSYELSLILVGHVDKTLDEDAVLSSPIAIVFDLDGTVTRRVHGVVDRIESGLHEESGRIQWTLRVVPRFALLGLTSTTEVVMDKPVPEIVEDRLKRAGLHAGDDYELSLQAAYAAREFVVQYKESHLDFVGRLTEHLGVTYFFKQTEEREVIVFCDQNSAFATEADGLRIPFRARGEKADVFELKSVTTTQPAKVRVRDYNYRTPTVDLSATSGGQDGATEQSEYGSHFKTPTEASRAAQVRYEELTWQRKVFHGKSSRSELSPGTRFKLEGHPSGDKDLLVVGVEHTLRQAAFGGSSLEPSYENSFQAIEATVPFRPLRRTPKPVVPGVITGVIEAAQAGDYAELDNDGRYHVRFAFDTGAAERGKASRPIRMAQPHAGPGYGIHFPLRDGVEVVLSCVKGDPDRPIISGAVPNPTTPSTVTSKNGARNVIRTGGGNEINIDDVAGSERIKLTVPFANTILQLGAPNSPHEGVHLGTDKKIHLDSGIGMDFVDGAEITATAPAVRLNGTTEATLNGEANAFVTSDSHVTVAAPTISNFAGSVHEESAPVITSTASAVWAASSGAIAILHGGATVTITGPVIGIEGSTISLRGDAVSIHATGDVTITGDGSVTVSGPTVNVKGDGVVNVSGPTVNVNGGGVVNVKAGSIKLN